MPITEKDKQKKWWNKEYEWKDLFVIIVIILLFILGAMIGPLFYTDW